MRNGGTARSFVWPFVLPFFWLVVRSFVCFCFFQMTSDYCNDYEPKVVVDILEGYYGSRYGYALIARSQCVTNLILNPLGVQSFGGEPNT